MLELEVMHLEKYLVTLYKKALDRRVASLSYKDIVTEQRISSDRFQMPQGYAASNTICLEDYKNETKEQEELLGCSIHRTHSSLSHHSAYPSRLSPLVGKVAEAVNSYHSLPLTLLEVNQHIFHTMVLVLYCTRCVLFALFLFVLVELKLEHNISRRTKRNTGEIEVVWQLAVDCWLLAVLVGLFD